MNVWAIRKKIKNAGTGDTKAFPPIYIILIKLDMDGKPQKKSTSERSFNFIDQNHNANSTDQFDATITFEKQKLSISVTVYEKNDYHDFEGVFTEKDIPYELIKFYGSISGLYEKSLSQKKGFDFFTKGPHMVLEIPYTNFTENTHNKRVGKLHLYRLQEKYKDEGEKIKKLLDRRNRDKENLEQKLRESGEKVADLEKQNDEMKKTIAKMEQMFTRANIPLFLRHNNNLDSLDFEEGNPNKIKIKRDAEVPILLIIKNDFTAKKEFKIRLSFPPIDKVEDHAIGLISESGVKKITSGEGMKWMQNSEDKIMYKFNGQLIYSYRNQVCEDMRLMKYTYIEMTIDMREQVVKFERGHETFAIAQLKVFKNHRFAPFIKIAQKNSSYEIDIM